MHQVFVYGTLRRRSHNHRLLESSKFVGNAMTEKKYAMFASGIPYVTERLSEIEIVGEVYEVDAETLKRLDRLEGHPDSYERRMIKVVLENGRRINAYLYFYDHIVSDGGSRSRYIRKVTNGDFINPEFKEEDNA